MIHVLSHLTGLTAPSAECSAGYVCELGSDTATPTDGVMGYECLRGYYCLQGSSVGIKCPLGTFSNNTGLQSDTECVSCTEGKYCEELGNCHITN